MRLLADATEMPRYKGKLTGVISLGVAGCLVVLAVGQLFTFEKFPEIIKLWLLPGGEPLVRLFAALIPTLEIFALPFLLSMRVSPLMRLFSLACGLMASLGWVLVAVGFAGRPLVNMGLLGATIPLAAGVLPVLTALVIAVGMIYVAVKYLKARKA